MRLKSLIRRFIFWFLGTKIHYFLIKNIVPYVRFTTYYTSLRGWKYHILYKELSPGDIILTIDHKKLTTLLIGGEFSHAAMCVSKDKSWEVSEMTHNDYTKSCFFDICKESDRVVILGVKDVSDEDTKRAIARCVGFLGSKYDVEFKLGLEALYCSELCLESWGNDVLKADLSDLVGIGRPYVSPTDLYNAEGTYVKIDSAEL